MKTIVFRCGAAPLSCGVRCLPTSDRNKTHGTKKDLNSFVLLISVAQWPTDFWEQTDLFTRTAGEGSRGCGVTPPCWCHRWRSEAPLHTCAAMPQPANELLIYLKRLTYARNDLQLRLWMRVEGISAVDTVSHKVQMSLPVRPLQVLRPRGGSLGERSHGKCGFRENLNGQEVQANKAPLVWIQLGYRTVKPG